MKKIFSLSFLIFLLYSKSIAQNYQVRVNIAVTPPYSTNIMDYAPSNTGRPGKMLITAQNSSEAEQEIYLRGEIKGVNNDVRIFTSPDYIPSASIKLNPFEVRQLYSQDIMDLYNPYHLSYLGTNIQDIQKTGYVPEGQYSICVRAFDARPGRTNLPLSPETPSGCFTVYMKNTEPPILILPRAEEEINPLPIQNVVFSWTVPAGTPPESSYKLKIVEMYDSDKNPNDIYASAPSFFEKEIMNPVFVYGASELPLIPGRKYAWAVSVIDPKGKMYYQNNGQSEVRAFTYGKSEVSTYAYESKPKQKSILPQINFTAIKTISDLNINTFKGKLVWAYRKSETGEVNEPKSYTKEKTEIKLVQNEKEMGNFLEKAHTPEYISGSNQAKTDTSAYLKNIEYFVLGSGVSTLLESTKVNISQQAEKNPVFSSERTNHIARIQELAHDTHYPLSGTKVSLFIKESVYSVNTGKISLPDKLLGQTITSENGDFSLLYYDKIPEKGFEAYLKIESPHFEFPDYDIPIRKENGVYDFGEILGLAKTYRLKVNVTDDRDRILNEVKISLERPIGFYDNPANINLTNEVLREQLNPQDKNNITAVSDSTGTAYWPRVFFSNGFSDSYSISIEGEGITEQNTLIKNLNLFRSSEKGNRYADLNEVPVLIKTYKVELPAPQVTGRVLTEEGETPIKEVVVFVREKGSKSKTAVKSSVTDENGYFKIANIPARQTPYEIVAQFQGKETISERTLYLSENGITENIDPFMIKTRLVTVIVRIVDSKGEIIPDATLTWKPGGNPFISDLPGVYMGSQVPGKHILIARKPGYKDTEYEVTLPDFKNESGKNTSTEYSKTEWAANLNIAVNNFKNIPILGNPTPSPTTNQKSKDDISIKSKDLNSIGKLNLDFIHDKLFRDSPGSATIESNHVIVMSNFYVHTTVLDDKTGKPIKGAILRAENSESTFTTNDSGIAIIEDISAGNSTVIASGPKDSFFCTVKTTFTLNLSQDTAYIKIRLKPGAMIKGIVTSGGNTVENVEIRADGLEYINTRTDAVGRFTLQGLPPGEFTLIASKEGFLADKNTDIYDENQSYEKNFDLKNPGFNASRLLGFKLVLLESKQGNSPNEFIISGELTDIPDNSVFSLNQGRDFRIRFTDKTIIKDGSKIYPKGNELVTDLSTISLKALDFLAVNLTDNTGLKIKEVAGSSHSSGEIIGEVLLDLNMTFTNITGIKLPQTPFSLKSGGNTKIAAINSLGNTGIGTIGISGKSEGWQLYGVTFSPDLSQSYLDQEGINLKGKIKPDGVPLLNNQELALKNVTISKNGRIKNIEINLTPKPTLKLVNWKLNLDNVDLNQYGLRLSGDFDIPVPSSANAKIIFKDLGVNNKTLSGGVFKIPEGGIDIFNLVSFKTTPGKDFSLQKLAGLSHYRFVGSGTIGLPKWIKQDITLDNFSIATNGQFDLLAKKDLELNFADMARVGITQFGFYSNTQTITVGGKFKLNIPMFGVGADGLMHFQKGKAPRLDDLGIDFDLMKAVSLQAKLAFNETSFRGKGSLKLAGLPGGSLEFWYINQTGKPKIGAQFEANAIIPVGLVNLTKIRGGFDFDYSQNQYSVNIATGVTLAPDPQGVVSLDLSAKITAAQGGPIFQGTGKAIVLNSWGIANAEVMLDFNRKQFFVDGKFGTGFNLMKGISAESHAGVRVELNTAPEKNFFFVSGYTRTKIAKIFDTGVTVAAGWNVPKNAHASLSQIPDYVLTNGKLYGGYFGADSKIDLGPYTLDFKLASISAWYKNYGLCEVYANFKKQAFGFNIKSDWLAGAQLDIIGIGKLASADIGLSGELSGIFTEGNVFVSGNFAGHIRGRVGCDGDCNNIAWACSLCPIPCGFKVCLGTKASASYDTINGLNLQISLFE